MKKLFISALLTMTVAASALASGANKESVILPGNFNFEIKKTSNLSWTENKQYTRASYIVNNKKMEAFYSLGGELIGTSETISLEELPANAKKSFAKKYEGYTVKEVLRFEGAEESAYYISAENEKESVYLKVDKDNSISVFKSTKK